jgi:hypothetical protein
VASDVYCGDAGEPDRPRSGRVRRRNLAGARQRDGRYGNDVIPVVEYPRLPCALSPLPFSFFLFHERLLLLNEIGFPTALRDLLESGNSTKAGVGIQCKLGPRYPFFWFELFNVFSVDCKKLWRDHRVSVRNCVDLSLMARSVDKRWKGPYKHGIGLSHLAEVYLNHKVRKGYIQTSNWELELSTRQQECKSIGF